uniref:Uncharacterized protein n=1 Tax=Peronospora matthiolae TaxID=2874970 RepID=A0AAV1U968_9STRA
MGTAHATTTAAEMAVSTILSSAPPDDRRASSTNVELRTDHTQQFAVVELRMILPDSSLTPPIRPRRSPPPDRKRGISSSPEKIGSPGAIVPYMHNATQSKKGRVGSVPSTIQDKDEGYESIDRGDWASAWEILEANWPNAKKISFPSADSPTTEWQQVARHAPDHLL